MGHVTETALNESAGEKFVTVAALDNLRGLGLGGATFVPMMQPANLRHRYHAPRLRRLHRPTLRRVLRQRQMSARAVIILQEQLQTSVQRRFVDDDPVVQTLAPNCTDDPLDIRTLLRYPGAPSTS